MMRSTSPNKKMSITTTHSIESLRFAGSIVMISFVLIGYLAKGEEKSITLYFSL
jgi:hypothetical protein